MNPERFEALLWERIDGIISEQDLVLLDAALAQHPELETLERQVTRLASSLDDLERLPVPGELRQRITGSVTDSPRDEPYRQIPKNPSRRARRSRVVTPWLPVAASLALGITVGYLVHSVDSMHVDETTATGAMDVATTRPDSIVEIPLPDENGRVLVTRAKASTTFDLDLAADAEYAVLVKAARGGLNLASFEDQRGTASALKIGTDEVLVRSHGAGHHVLAVTTADPNLSLDLEIMIDGTTVARQTIEAAREGRAGGE